MAGRTLFLKFAVALPLTLGVAGLTACEEKGPTSESLDSTGGGGSGGSGGTGATKSVRIQWVASHAGDVGLAGGGYKVYVKRNTAPTATDTTPVVINHPGTGTHTTSTTLPLSSGRYFVSVSSFSANGDSPLSVPTLLVVP